MNDRHTSTLDATVRLMPSPPPGDALRLPARTRLLYIGPMKTGTTAVQHAARVQRRALLDHGVLYPGQKSNHRAAVGALLRWATRTAQRRGPLVPGRLDIDTGGVPHPRNWDRLKAEIEADTSRRILITHEYISQADDAGCRRIVEELGPGRLHIAITLRPPATILPSLWAQDVKSDAQTEPFESWLERIYADHPDPEMSERFRRAYDHGALVHRWAQLVGSDNVTVIVPDKTQPHVLTDAFETLLGLPAGMLADTNDTNRSLTASEATLFRRLNISLREHDVGWKSFYNLLWRGAVDLGPVRAGPGTGPRLRLPEWAGDAASRDGKHFADQIRDAGVRVVGDLDILGLKPETASQPEEEVVPIDLSVQALTGAILAGQKIQRSLDKTAARIRKLEKQNHSLRAQLAGTPGPMHGERADTFQTGSAGHVATHHTTRELLSALKQRLLSKLRTGNSDPAARSRRKQR